MGDTPYRGPGSTGPIIIHTPQPDKEERLVRIPADCIDDEPGAHEVSTTHAYNATPADLERAGWVEEHILVTARAERDEARRERDAALAGMARVSDHVLALTASARDMERERDEALKQAAAMATVTADVCRALAQAGIVDCGAPAEGVVRLNRQRDEARAERDNYRANYGDVCVERDEVRRQRDAEIASRDALARVLEQVERERDEARCLYEAAHCERMRITDVLQRVERERDEARAALATWQGSAEQERARCVAWLRAEAASSDWASCATWGRALSDTADRLERGEHADTPVPAAEPRATDEELVGLFDAAASRRAAVAAVAARVRREQPAHAELDAAWAAAQVPVRGLTTLADVITTLRERPAVCIVTRAVEAGVKVTITRTSERMPGCCVGLWDVRVTRRPDAPGEYYSHGVPAADVPKTLARLLGEVTRGQ